MAAWKSVSGNYLSASQPVTLIPNSEIPLVTTDDPISSTEPAFKVAAALGALYYKLSTPESLRDFVGIIQSLEILVSEPLIKYDTYDYLLPLRHVTTDNYCESLDLTTDLISQNRICTQTLNLAWKANLSSVPIVENQLSDTTIFHPFAQIPLSSMASDNPAVWQRVVAGNISGTKISYRELTNPGSNLKSELLIIEGKGENINVITRPLKLDNAGKLKTISRVFLRGNYTPSTIIITVYGSRDMIRWWKIAKTKGGTVASLPRSPFRFFKIEISGLLHEGENLQGVSVM